MCSTVAASVRPQPGSTSTLRRRCDSQRIPLIGSLYSRNASPFPVNVEYGDIVKGLPVADGRYRAVYCSHVLEHLSLDEFRLALRNTRALLQDGGICRLVMPDFEECVKAYTSSQDAEAAIRFMSSSGLGTETRPRSLGSRAVRTVRTCPAPLAVGLQGRPARA